MRATKRGRRAGSPSRILRGEPKSLWPWVALWFASSMMVFLAVSNIRASEEGTIPLNYLSMLLTFPLIRTLYNRRYKGEWLLDEALAYLRHALTIMVATSIFFLPVALLRGPILNLAITYATLIAIILLLQIVLWIVGRTPYKSFQYKH